MLYIVFIVLIFIASLLIILAVLAQNPKGGMAANFGASNQVMGVRQTTSFLERFTWGLAIVLLLLSVGATMTVSQDKIQASKSAMDKGIEQSAGAAGAFDAREQPTSGDEELNLLEELAAPAEAEAVEGEAQEAATTEEK